MKRLKYTIFDFECPKCGKDGTLYARDPRARGWLRGECSCGFWGDFHPSSPLIKGKGTKIMKTKKTMKKVPIPSPFSSKKRKKVKMEMDNPPVEDSRFPSPFDSDSTMREKIKECLYHEFIIDPGIGQSRNVIGGDALSSEAHDEFVVHGALPPPRIFEIHKLSVKCLARMPHFILQEMGNFIVISLHIGVKDYIHAGPLGRLEFDGINREWSWNLIDRKLWLPPLQSFYVRIVHPPIRFDIEPFKVRVQLDGFLGREIL